MLLTRSHLHQCKIHSPKFITFRNNSMKIQKNQTSSVFKRYLLYVTNKYDHKILTAHIFSQFFKYHNL